MTNMAPILAILALAAAGQGDRPANASTSVRSGSITATVGMSERQPPGLLSLDLRSGRYQLAPLPPAGGSAGFRIVHVRQGRLAAAQLEEVRAAFAAAVDQGLIEPACRAGAPPPRLIVSNGGVRTMELTGQRGTLTAPRDLGCWTEAGQRLHDLLETRFASEVRRDD